MQRLFSALTLIILLALGKADNVDKEGINVSDTRSAETILDKTLLAILNGGPILGSMDDSFEASALADSSEGRSGSLNLRLDFKGLGLIEKDATLAAHVVKNFVLYLFRSIESEIRQGLLLLLQLVPAGELNDQIQELYNRWQNVYEQLIILQGSNDYVPPLLRRVFARGPSLPPPPATPPGSEVEPESTKALEADDAVNKAEGILEGLFGDLDNLILGGQSEGRLGLGDIGQNIIGSNLMGTNMLEMIPGLSLIKNFLSLIPPGQRTQIPSM